MRKLFAILAIASAVYGNELSYKSLQSGPNGATTPLYDHGIHGEGQIIAFLDTGVDYDTCFFVEPDGRKPPINTRVDETTVDLTRRKIIAYDFLYSCDQYPNAATCDDPNSPTGYDSQGHGTHAAASAAGDRGTPITHDYGDAIATGAKIVVQDAGVSGNDLCTQRPGIGCPVNLTPIFTQAYLQGARIHSNSWGDEQGSPFSPPTANYPQSAHDVDAFVWSHPDFLVVFNTGNFGNTGMAPPSTLSAPGSAKNTLDVGGTRDGNHYADDEISSFTLVGPTRDGRIKPDVVGPAYVMAGDAKIVSNGQTCGISFQPGTSWASPSIAGAVALVRQYYTDGFYPTGIATPANRIIPSAALLKATIIASAERVPYYGPLLQPTQPVPSYEQGFGFPVLDDALYFPGDASKLKIEDVPLDSGLTQGQTSTLPITARAGTPLKVVLVWTDPPGTVSGRTDSTPQLVNDLDLRLTDPAGTSIWGNDVLHPGQPDRLNNVEAVSIAQPLTGTYTITVSAPRLGLGPRQSYALVVTGDIGDGSPHSVRAHAARH
ncbi:MAG TPA: S8 family serine peptidase [Thermoanaerobaculia bacterium]|nr:S8 family serine peptidase [Thermoanaerobaculia bacterium]